MSRSELNAGSDVFDRDVHAIAASLNDIGPAETGAGNLPGRPDGLEQISPVILQRRASRGLESRLNDEQRPRLFEGEDGRRAIEQRLDCLDARLEGISRSVEFSEAFLSLRLKQQLQEVVQTSVAGHVGPERGSALRRWVNVLLILIGAASSALLVAEVHNDHATGLVDWTRSQVEAMRDNLKAD
ncbi:hypothetical protein REJC140_03025 [Pseudorhizobium endolithicum]|uniref:Nutrient deprivation-induced protein n=1 Tax=Pseudorhizobium endolithicum TaxID=1191678 RepID=A0ABN7JIU8_9HYPH|nr:hypothetical protein [Pseudorhizobium endolithicum]CAD6436610.1 hypothetical protein REQ54_04016 [Rhizobium sp. Q54]CAD7032232.1 hypothetical protein REJC140_03025 [Pseudorhizobium endolithicum]